MTLHDLVSTFRRLGAKPMDPAGIERRPLVSLMGCPVFWGVTVIVDPGGTSAVPVSVRPEISRSP